MGGLDSIDRLLHPRAVDEASLIAFAFVLDLVDEIFDEVGVEEAAPRFPGMSRGRVESCGDRLLFELHAVRRRDADGLGDAKLFDEPANDGALLAVDPCFDAGIIPETPGVRQVYARFTNARLPPIMELALGAPTL